MVIESVLNEHVKFNSFGLCVYPTGVVKPIFQNKF